MTIKQFFKPLYIIESRFMPKGVLIYNFLKFGKKYARCSINLPPQQRKPGYVPVTDIDWKNIISITKKPSPFKKWRFKLIGKVAQDEVVYQKQSLQKK